MGSLFLELSKQESLLKMMEERGFTLCQQNGQRTYGGPPPGWGSRPPPNRDCEVFIGRLPRMCFEDELIPLFASMGELYEFRLMLDFSGTNRGYAYAHYTKPEGAIRAIKYLNKFEIRPGHLIGVLKSKNNCRLLIGNIKSAINVNNFTQFIRTATDQVLNVVMFDNFNELKSTEYRISSEVEEAFLGRVPKNDGKFAIVEYENHKAAAVARRVLIPKYGHILAIDWAVPPRDRKRFYSGTDSAGSSSDFPIQTPTMTSSTPSKIGWRSINVSPAYNQVGNALPSVPVLVIKPSIMNNVSPMPRVFCDTLTFFKHMLRICAHTYVWQLNIPSQIYREIERKVIDRISNMENCGEGVQLLMNYFYWWLDKTTPGRVSSEIQTILEEVKLYANAFLQFIWSRTLSGGAGDDNPAVQNFFWNVLPLKLSLLYYISLAYNSENPFRFVVRISKGLQWLDGLIEKGSKPAKDFLTDLLRFILGLDPEAYEKAMKMSPIVLRDLASADFLYDIQADKQILSLNGY